MGKLKQDERERKQRITLEREPAVICSTSIAKNRKVKLHVCEAVVVYTLDSESDRLHLNAALSIYEAAASFQVYEKYFSFSKGLVTC